MLNAKDNDTFPYRILVIDNQLSQLKLMKSRLSNYGCTVVTVDSAEEAEQMLKWGERFSLIITALKMPWLNGLQFCKRIKARYPEIKVCALSGNLEEFEIDELERSGFDSIYEKPISNERLKQMLVNAHKACP